MNKIPNKYKQSTTCLLPIRQICGFVSYVSKTYIFNMIHNTYLSFPLYFMQYYKSENYLYLNFPLLSMSQGQCSSLFCKFLEQTEHTNIFHLLQNFINSI